MLLMSSAYFLSLKKSSRQFINVVIIYFVSCITLAINLALRPITTVYFMPLLHAIAFISLRKYIIEFGVF